MKKKYLYGASVQGIQGFIFETNKLREIAGASQLVDNICTSEFEEYCKSISHTIDNDDVIMRAAGIIKYKVDKEAAKDIVKGFPKHISNYAPGLTISQAVVEYDENDVKATIDKLEEKLKVQRNIVSMPVDIGFMGLNRARRTGGVAFSEKNDKNGTEVQSRSVFVKEPLKDRKGNNAWLLKNKPLTDEDTLELFRKFTDKPIGKQLVPFDLNEITKRSENSWIAIIHADGNGLGKILANLSDNVPNEKREKVFKEFSQSLELATENSAKRAFKLVEKKFNEEKLERYPIRPVILGGDDLTVIIRADLAYDFAKDFLKSFEQETEKLFEPMYKYGVKGLTACAGIAYIKDSYPFHYGVHLAESLVKEAKKKSKSEELRGKTPSGKEIPSSISFYKVQSSFTEELSEMKKRTHCAKVSDVNFDYGPYFIEKIEGQHCVSELDEKLKVLENFRNDKSKGISKLRQYIAELYKDRSKAIFMMDRISTVNKDLYEQLELESEREKDTMIINDLIQLHTFKEEYNDKD